VEETGIPVENTNVYDMLHINVVNHVIKLTDHMSVLHC